jgi:hypothetical protein
MLLGAGAAALTLLKRPMPAGRLVMPAAAGLRCARLLSDRVAQRAVVPCESQSGPSIGEVEQGSMLPERSFGNSCGASDSSPTRHSRCTTASRGSGVRLDEHGIGSGRRPSSSSVSPTRLQRAIVLSSKLVRETDDRLRGNGIAGRRQAGRSFRRRCTRRPGSQSSTDARTRMWAATRVPESSSSRQRKQAHSCGRVDHPTALDRPRALAAVAVRR